MSPHPIGFEVVLTILRKRYPQQPFESDIDYAVRIQAQLDKNKLWTADDATPDELELRTLKQHLDYHLT